MSLLRRHEKRSDTFQQTLWGFDVQQEQTEIDLQLTPRHLMISFLM